MTNVGEMEPNRPALPDICSELNSLVLQGKIKIKSQANKILLLVRALAGVVLVLIVGIEFDVLAYGEQTTCIESGGAPFVILTLVIRFGSDIRDQVIGTD